MKEFTLADAREMVRRHFKNEFNLMLTRRFANELVAESEDFSSDEVTALGRYKASSRNPPDKDKQSSIGPTLYGPAIQRGWIKQIYAINSKSPDRKGSSIPHYAVTGKAAKAGALIIQALDEFEAKLGT